MEYVTLLNLFLKVNFANVYQDSSGFKFYTFYSIKNSTLTIYTVFMEQCTRK